MFNTFKVLFSFSIFFISLSSCDVVKRKAPDGQLYVFSGREGCESVESEAPCTLTWQLNPYVAKMYKEQNEMVATATQLYRSMGINDFCTQAVENVLCSQVVPRCSLEDGSREYGKVSKLCQDVYNKCPLSIAYNLKQKKFCQRLKTGKHPNSECVAPSSAVTGACPQPKYKMPSEFLADYRKRSAGLVQTFDNLQNLRYDNGERIFSSECILLTKEIGCSPLYCSADERSLLVKHDQDDCKKIMKECYEDILSKSSGLAGSLVMKSFGKILKSACDVYPKSATAQLKAEPPTLSKFPQQSQREHPNRVPQEPPQDHPNRVPQEPQQDHPNRDSQEPQQHHPNRVPASIASCQFGHPKVLAAIVCSFMVIMKFYV